MIRAAVGFSSGNDAREAGLQAAHQALSLVGGQRPSFGLVVFSAGYQVEDVYKGVTSVLTNVPLAGFSTNGVLVNTGNFENGVGVAVYYQDDLYVQDFYEDAYARSVNLAAEALRKRIKAANADACLLFADAFNGDIGRFLEFFSGWEGTLLGGLSAGPVRRGRNYQLSSQFTGLGAAVGLVLRGDAFRMGYGARHGWQPSGKVFRVTRSRGFWVRTLDGRPASDAYAELFQFPAREWVQEPLASNVRLYPLGLSQGDGRFQVRAPMRVEIDGSFRFNTLIQDGQDGYLMVGSPSLCLRAVQDAASQALYALGKYRPALAVILVDDAWRMLLAADEMAVIEALQSVIGENVPVLGGYVLGEFFPADDTAAVSLHDNHIVVLLFPSETEFEDALAAE
jgi:hypothetical protein